MHVYGYLKIFLVFLKYFSPPFLLRIPEKKLQKAFCFCPVFTMYLVYICAQYRSTSSAFSALFFVESYSHFDSTAVST